MACLYLVVCVVRACNSGQAQAVLSFRHRLRAAHDDVLDSPAQDTGVVGVMTDKAQSSRN